MSEDNADHVARGLASEAIQAVRSQEKFSNLQFSTMTVQHKELKDAIEGLVNEVHGIRAEMNKGFKGYDDKFWSLAITIIVLLVGAVGVLVYGELHPH